MGHTLDNVIWRKSSYSGSNGGDCVEVAVLPDPVSFAARPMRKTEANAASAPSTKGSARRTPHPGLSPTPPTGSIGVYGVADRSPSGSLA